jgi:hypothetical protein
MRIVTTLEPRVVSVTRSARLAGVHRLALAVIVACATSVTLAGVAAVTAAPESPVAIEQTVEETAMDGATRIARTVTHTGSLLAPAPPVGAPPVTAAPPAGRDGSLLWVDPIHLNGIAQNMAITGDGNHVVAGWWLNNARVAAYDIGGTGVPNWTFSISTSFFTPVDASNDGSVVTATGRQDQLYAWDVGSSTPYCAENHPVGYEGGLAITPDVGGTFGGSSNQSSVDAWAYGYDDDCTKRFGDTLPGQTQGGRFAAAGDWFVVNSRTHAVVFDALTGAARDSVSIPGETQAAAGISGDGSILAVGGFSRRTYVYEWDGNEYVLLWNHFVPGVTWITAIDVSDDGSTVMVGTLLIATPYRGKVVMYDVAGGPTPLWEDGGYGDEVASVALSADGSIGVAGSWGRQAGTLGPIVAVYQRDSATPIFTIMDDEIPSVASCYAVDISNDGTHGCAGGKAVHARDFGNGGYCLAFEVQPTTAVELDDRRTPAAGSRLVLGQNRPNPLHPATSIPFTLRAGGDVELRIYDAGGRTVLAEQLGRFDAGSHSVSWNGADLRGQRVPSGVYFYEVEAGGVRAARRLIVTR